MKKLLSIATLLGVMSGAASAAPYVMPSSQPGALTPYDIQPVYSVEGLYGIANKSDDPDTYGARLSFSLYSDATETFRHQFNLNIAGLWGSETLRDEYGSYDMDVFMMPITAGYNINIELCDDVMLYLGGKIGYAFCEVESDGYSADGDGLTFSVGGGFKFQCSDSVYAHVGYEFGRTYMGGDVDYNYGQHTIVVGVGCQF